MSRSVENAPAAVLAAAKELLARGLEEGAAGNVSARQSDGTVCVTGASVDYRTMVLEDLVVVDLDGKVVSGEHSPSSELPLHLAVYNAFDDVGAVIHSHPVHATMFAVARQPIPSCIDEFTIHVGGDVRVTEYAMSGNEHVGSNAVAALEGRGAALLANHGLVAVGPSPAKALHITALVERSAFVIWGARQLGEVHHLPEKVDQQYAGVYEYLRQN
jgi:L-fuculose-phosphate aldolase